MLKLKDSLFLNTDFYSGISNSVYLLKVPVFIGIFGGFQSKWLQSVS